MTLKPHICAWLPGNGLIFPTTFWENAFAVYRLNAHMPLKKLQICERFIGLFVGISSDFHGFICSFHTLWLLTCYCRNISEVIGVNLPVPNYSKTQQIANRQRDSWDIPLSTLYFSTGTFVKCWTSTNSHHEWCFSFNNWQNFHYWQTTLSDLNK